MPVRKGGGGNEPPRRTRETSLLSKMVPVVKKKALVDLLGLTCKLGHLLFVPKKKETRKSADRGAFASQSLITTKKASAEKQQTWQKLSKKQRSLVEGATSMFFCDHLRSQKTIVRSQKTLVLRLGIT